MVAKHKRKIIGVDGEEPTARSCYETILTRADIDSIVTPEGMAIARMDGVCPRCDKRIEVDGGVLCSCGFSF